MSELARDLIEIVASVPRFDYLRPFCQPAVILGAVPTGYPAFQLERVRAVGRDPFAVVFSGEMNVCTIGNPTFLEKQKRSLSGKPFMGNAGEFKLPTTGSRALCRFLWKRKEKRIRYRSLRYSPVSGLLKEN